MKEYFQSKQAVTGIAGVQLRHTSYFKFGFPRHFHNYYSLIVPQAGVIKETHNYELHPGSVFFFTPGDIHAGESKYPEHVAFASVTIDNQCVSRLLGPAHHDFRFDKVLKDDQQSLSLVKRLLEALKIQEGPKAGIVDTLFIDLLHRLSADAPKEPTAADAPFVMRAKEYIKDNYRINFTLEELAEACHTSPYHLSRTFKKQTGMSPFSYLHNFRVEQVKKGMPPKSWAQAAAMAGYYDQSHFYRHFKRLNGLPPGEWHRQ